MTSPKKKILVIDDDEAVFGYLQSKIGHLYDLVTTTQPELAINVVRQEKPDLILCDIDMPELSGGDLAVLFAEYSHTRDIPFAYLTSYVSPSEVRSLAGNVGGRKGIAKRTPIPEMIEIIERMLS